MKRTKICTNEYEQKLWAEGRLLVGIDEAGRGPLAGPLVTAGVVFPIGYSNPEIYDSKALSEKKRNELFEVIKRDALYFEILEIPEKDIDFYNIYRADQLAMEKIALDMPVDFVLTDAMPLAIPKETASPVKGDQKSISVAAGSILAKVTRDRLMEYYDQYYPMYGFKQNKGYPTRQHMQAIENYGITKIHRRSFGPVAAVQMKLDI